MIAKKIFLFIVLFIVWLFLTCPFSPLNMQDISAGLAVALIVTVFLRVNTTSPRKYFELKRYFWGIGYIPVLIYYMVLANLDVLYRVLHPDMPIKPGIVKIRTKLTDRLARTILCNSITLTPGTMVIDIVDDLIYVHWINVSEKSISEATEKIAGPFERILKRIFE